jgi:uncharacterized protein YcbK (DUF882 family)
MKLRLALVGALIALFESTALAEDRRSLWIRNVHTNEELRVQPFGDSGIPRITEWNRIVRLFRSWRTDKRRTINPRLLRTLAHLQSQVGGRRIELVSGYRAPENDHELHSYHSVGRSADIYVDGVSNRAIFEWCRHQENLGCGYYPVANSHVHIDVRSRPGIWVDLSHTGEQAAYVPDPLRWLRDHPAAAVTP